MKTLDEYHAEIKDAENKFLLGIFKTRWEVSVPKLTMLTGNEFVMTTYDLMGKPKQQDVMERVVCYKTIAEMAEICSEGYAIGILNLSDVPKIYEIIEGHIKFVMQKSDEFLRLPKEDLVLLDEFASNIYENHAGMIVEDSHKVYRDEISSLFGGEIFMQKFDQLTATDIDNSQVEPRKQLIKRDISLADLLNNDDEGNLGL